jgi:hypothetical protein
VDTETLLAIKASDKALIFFLRRSIPNADGILIKQICFDELKSNSKELKRCPGLTEKEVD